MVQKIYVQNKQLELLKNGNTEDVSNDKGLTEDYKLLSDGTFTDSEVLKKRATKVPHLQLLNSNFSPKNASELGSDAKDNLKEPSISASDQDDDEVPNVEVPSNENKKSGEVPMVSVWTYYSEYGPESGASKGSKVVSNASNQVASPYDDERSGPGHFGKANS